LVRANEGDVTVPVRSAIANFNDGANVSNEPALYYLGSLGRMRGRPRLARRSTIPRRYADYCQLLVPRTSMEFRSLSLGKTVSVLSRRGDPRRNAKKIRDEWTPACNDAFTVAVSCYLSIAAIYYFSEFVSVHKLVWNLDVICC